jgi:hypothetical protein
MVPIPLVRDFHFESAFLAALFGAFWAGWKAANRKTRYDMRLGIGISKKIAVFAVPIFINSFIQQCLSWDGAGFWLLLPFPSVFFGLAVGRFYRKTKSRAPRFLTLTTLVAVGLGVFLAELFTLPQVYYFNHVWGAWPGPIYDQEVTLSASYFYFRGITALWIALLWIIPGKRHSRWQFGAIGGLAVLLLITLFFRPELRINTPSSYLKQQLPQTKTTEHFKLYFAADLFTPEEMEYWAARHEFHFQQIINLLEIEWPEGRMIESYLYGNAWQKKELVGAKFTSYVPVWLEQDQLHIAKEHLNGVLKHEMVHVLAKQFGNSLIKASWNIGLVEGLAEGIAADASDVSTLNQIMAADPPYPTVEEMHASLTLSGFYSSAGSISYTTAGSFVQFLLEEYPVEDLKKAYQKSSFDGAFEVSFDSLVNHWLRQLPSTQTDSVDEQVSDQIFSQLSVFQIQCPHNLSPLLKSWDEITKQELSGDSTAAFSELDALYTAKPDILLIKQKWADYQLNSKRYEAVIDAFSSSDTVAAFKLLKADALFLNGMPDSAQVLLQQIQLENPEASLSLQHSFEVRAEPQSWSIFTAARYRNSLPQVSRFEQLSQPLQWLVINRSVQLYNHSALVLYAQSLDPADFDNYWFESIIAAIDRLIYVKEFELADWWIQELSSRKLRERYLERLGGQREWLEYIRASGA